MSGDGVHFQEGDEDDRPGHEPEMSRRIISSCGSGEIKLLSHCVFCLRATRNPNKLRRSSYQKMESSNCEFLRVVPEARHQNSTSSSSSHLLLVTLNQIWSYLQQKNGGGVDDGGTGSHLDFTEFVALGKARAAAASFSELPKMCQFCAERLESVHRQLVELMKELRKLGSVIRESKMGGRHCWRAEQFERDLRDSSLEEASIQAALKFVGNLGEDDDDDDKPIFVFTTAKESADDNELLEDPLLVEDSNAEGEEDFDGGMEDGREDDSDSDYIKSEQDEEDEDDGSFTLEENFEEEQEDTEQIDQRPVNIKKKRGRPPNTAKAARKRPSPVTGSEDDCGGAEKNVACDLCDYRTIKKKNLENHTRRVHKKRARPQGIKCDLCKDKVSPTTMYAHVAAHVGEEYCIKCPNPECPLVYSQPYSMSHHLVQAKSCRAHMSPEDLPKLPASRSRHKYHCPICDHVTTNCAAMVTHLTNSHETDTKNLPCPISGCERRFTVKESVILHLPHHDFTRHVTTQPCDLCPMKSFKRDKMMQHLKQEHGVNQIISCHLCAFMFPTRNLLLDHLLAHKYSGMTCDICNDGVTFSEHSDLRDHYFRTHKIGQKFCCERCENVYWSTQALVRHQKEAHPKDNDQLLDTGEEGGRFPCEFCPEVVYKTSRALKEHRIRLHGADKYKCKFCSEEFSRSVNLQKHERGHRGLPPKEYPCLVEGCGQTFRQNKNLKRHHSVTHLGVRAHVCEICGKSYRDAQALRGHKDSVHLGLRPYVCNECGESFSDGTTLRRHMRIHTGERPHACDQCGQRFRQREVLRRHLEGHQRKGADFKPNGPMKEIRKRVELKTKKNPKSD